MPLQDFAGRTVAEIVEAFTSGKAAARDIVEGVLTRAESGQALQPRHARHGRRPRGEPTPSTPATSGGTDFGALAAVPVSLPKTWILTKACEPPSRLSP